MNTVEERYDTIQSLSEQLVSEMKKLKEEVDEAHQVRSHCDDQLSDLKQTISFLNTHASESSRITKMIEALRKERRVAKKAIALYEDLEYTLSTTSKELMQMETKIKEARTRKPMYFFRSREVYGFLDEIQQVDARSKANYALSDSLKREETITSSNEILKDTSPRYRISHEKSGKRINWKMQNMFTGVLVFEGNKFSTLLKMMDVYNCINIDFTPGTKPQFTEAIQSFNNGIADDELRRVASRYYYSLVAS